MTEERKHSDGWARDTDGVYAKDAWRIQRGARGWVWSNVVSRELGGSGAFGREPTLRLAKAAVAFEIRELDGAK